MSFSATVKKELTNLNGGERHCSIAEIAGLINTCGNIHFSQTNCTTGITTENVIVAKRFFTLIKKTFQYSCGVSVKKSKQFNKNRLYLVYVNDSIQAQKVLQSTGLLSNENGILSLKKRIDPLVVSSTCCKRAYIRGVFVSGGSVCDPEKTYHLEFVNGELTLSMGLSDLINSFGLNSKVIERKAHYVVYLKEGENIVDLLNIMGAHISLMNLENVRILKLMRNKVNRIVNCETANLSKTVNAAVKQVEDIQFIVETRGFHFLSEQLEEVAKIRLMYPELSLKEVGLLLTPAVSKSGVNHRLRKISEIADCLRGGLL